jgi:hypothetical protein
MPERQNVDLRIQSIRPELGYRDGQSPEIQKSRALA